MLKPPKCLYIAHSGRFSTFRNSHFPSKFPFKFQTFLMPHSGCHVLRFWRILVPKCLILGSLGPQWWPKWRPRSPKRYPKGCGVDTFLGPTTDSLPRSLSERSWAPFLLILGGPWHQNLGFPYDVSTHVDEVLDIISGHRFASSGVNAPNFR